MIFLRRLLLVLMVLTVPAAATAGLYYLSLYLLAILGRIVTDPVTLTYMAYGEFALFTFGAILEAHSRWTAPSYNQ